MIRAFFCGPCRCLPGHPNRDLGVFFAQFLKLMITIHGPSELRHFSRGHPATHIMAIFPPLVLVIRPKTDSLAILVSFSIFLGQSALLHAVNLSHLLEYLPATFLLIHTYLPVATIIPHDICLGPRHYHVQKKGATYILSRFPGPPTLVVYTRGRGCLFCCRMGGWLCDRGTFC